VRRDDERLADILEAAEKIAVRAAKGRVAFDADEDTQIVLVHPDSGDRGVSWPVRFLRSNPGALPTRACAAG
jgi:hypothetical protein